MPSARRRLELDGPYDMGRSLVLGDYGRANPTLRRPSGAELLRAHQTPAGPVSVHVRVGAGELEAQAWGPGREWILAELPRLLGLDDHPPALTGKLARIQRRLPGVRLGQVADLFDLLASYVIRQRVAWRDAVASQCAILRAHAAPAPGPEGLQLRLPLSADQWGALTTADLAGFGLDRKRAKTVLSLSARADRIRGWASLEPAEFTRRLEAFTGVGPWTRAMVQGVGLGLADAVPLGDYDLPSMVAWALVGEREADDARMLELLEPHRGQRFRVIHLLWAAGVHPPRRGHRIRGAGPGQR